ncbi:Acyl-CoA dehydrogenase family member 11 [Trichoplax sp. H2]|nr:Acyl-CoA dehydrogenase family member 11 [Trichoplax sp. H2]|eukprot:RDD41034.1 Acyl-CoA dehydrogenase family member 11 [Trichoplax sp. H2]
MSNNDTTPVRSQHRFEEARLRNFMMQHVDDFPQQSNDFTVRQYSSGQSNPTFYIAAGGKEFVMRKKPPGKLLPKAHMVNREYRILSALYSIGYPVPKPFAYCQDPSVIGTEFYIMQHVRGRIFRDPELPGMTPGQRQAIYAAMMGALAKLHSIDWSKIGLGDFGPTTNYSKRQVSTWNKQYIASKTSEVSEMDYLFKWLSNNIPENEGKTTIVHGDFRVDNMIFHPTEPRVIAVLDWELSTLGNPLSDVAYCCTPYHMIVEELKGLTPSFAFSKIPGIPTEKELTDTYCYYRGLKPPLPNWNFYCALSIFRMVGITQGVYARSIQGNASSETAQTYGRIVPLAAKAGVIAALSKSSEFTAFDDNNGSFGILKLSSRTRELQKQMKEFMKKYVFPAEQVIHEHLQNASNRWTVLPMVEELKTKAKQEGLWNLFLPGASGLSQVEYATLAEITGWSDFAPEIFNCNAPDTGNMEVLHLYGSDEQKREWLEPLLEGKIRSCYCMTEPYVASSDATNMALTITRDGDYYIVNGRKWWSSGAGDPRCKIAIVMGRTGGKEVQKHRSHSMILVPMQTPGVKKLRALTVFGYDDAPHGHLEIEFDNVRVPASNIILGEGRGFEISQGRLGPGRIHHCMRLIGRAERALSLMCDRVQNRVAFNKKLAEMNTIQHHIARSRQEIEQARLLTLKAARLIDLKGTKAARKEIAMIKVVAPNMCCEVVDRAIQAFGGAGVCQDTILPYYYVAGRTLRIADGPDEVHLTSVAKLELREQTKAKL